MFLSVPGKVSAPQSRSNTRATCLHCLVRPSRQSGNELGWLSLWAHYHHFYRARARPLLRLNHLDIILYLCSLIVSSLPEKVIQEKSVTNSQLAEFCKTKARLSQSAQAGLMANLLQLNHVQCMIACETEDTSHTRKAPNQVYAFPIS